MSENQHNEFATARKTPVFYANSVAVTTSSYDFSLLLIREAPGSEGPLPIDNLLLYMSPVLVKRLSEILVSVIERYEKNIGVIPSPPQRELEAGDLYGNNDDSE